MFQTNILKKYDSKHFCKVPNLKVGQMILLDLRIQEGDKSRIQKFKGLLISQKNTGYSQSIRVRKMVQKIGIEKICCLNSRQIENVQIVKQYSTKHAKMYYIRNIIGKSLLTKD
uniref:50S ribosomal protein L19 n=1 Tax=Codium simulans TaxID=589376 RepID=A0A1I9LKJ5_9CHLO|nr:50S ribosomal protein L19 [Codium simulans]ANJ70856.1 50S ribosomal protein L19 [Codium simulans]